MRLEPLSLIQLQTPMLRTIAFFAILIVTGCSTTNKANISNAIPYEVQQNIRTSEVEQVRFEFTPAESGELIEETINGMATMQYEVNDPMRGLFTELMQSKFATISDDASDLVKVDIMEVTHSTRRFDHSLSMRVRVTTVKDGEEKSREFAYSDDMEIGFETEGFTSTAYPPSDDIHDLMMKFVIATDRFIDSSFGLR